MVLSEARGLWLFLEIGRTETANRAYSAGREGRFGEIGGDSPVSDSIPIFRCPYCTAGADFVLLRAYKDGLGKNSRERCSCETSLSVAGWLEPKQTTWLTS